jgi:hypothetical protein
MLKISRLLAVSAFLVANSGVPAMAQLSSSEKIGPGHPDYVEAPASGAYLNGAVQQNATIYGSAGVGSSGNPYAGSADGHYAGSADGPSALYAGSADGPSAPNAANTIYGTNNMMYGTDQSTYQPTGVANVDMGAPAVEMGAMGGLGAMGSGMSASPIGDGMSQAMTAAAAVGLLGSSAMNAMGDSLRGMGFGGGFRGHAGPGGRGRGPYRSSGRSYSSGGGGSITGTVNRALDRNLNYAADQATRKLMWGLWH